MWHIHSKHIFIVDIAKRSCNCNFWELVGIPYKHVVVALGYRQQKPEDLVDDYYSKVKYIECYDNNVSPINGEDMWLEVEVEEIIPPAYKRGPDRPKKLKRREPYEDPNKGRTTTYYRCTKCGKNGHNRRNCLSQANDPKAAKRKVNILLVPFYNIFMFII